MPATIKAQGPRRPGRLLLSIALAALLGCLFVVAAFSGQASAQEPPGQVFILEADGMIGPGLASMFQRIIKEAHEEGASCCIILLDTPGGLSESMRGIVKDIMASPVPVVVFVSPGGARAASAGVMITMAADVAVMAPGTNIGAAHPVAIPMPGAAQELEGVMKDKVVNDFVANARSIAEKRGRNADWAEKAIRDSVSITETEAVELKVVDFSARDLDDLLEKLEGREIPGKGVLHVKDAERHYVQERFREKVLRVLGDPNWAFIFLVLGLAGLYFEFTNPGAILPGVIGGISLVLAAYSFSLLPVNFVGVLLILLAAVMFVLETQIASHGALSIGGVISLALGAIMLFDYDASGVRVAWSVLVPAVIGFSAFFVLVAGLVIKAHGSKVKTGSAGIVGEKGKVTAVSSPGRGKVLVHAEIWNACFPETLNIGDAVKVTGVDGLLLTVKKIVEP